MATFDLQLGDPFNTVINAGTAHTTPNGLPNTPIAAPVTPVINSNVPYGPVQPAPVIQATTPKPATPGTPAGQQYTPAATPVTTPTAPVTVGQALGFNAGTPETYGDPTIEKYLRDQAYGVVDEKKIQRDQLKQFRQEIDATNKIYDQMVAEERLRGEGRLGSGAAMAARGGILGSDFYGAQNEKILGYNKDLIGGIQAERQAKIANIMGTARKAAADEIAAKNLARREGADAYLKYLSGSQERKKSNLSTLAKRLISQDVSPTDMDKKELEEVAKTYGVSTSDIIASYQDEKQSYDASKAESDLKTRKTEAEIKKIDADIASGKLLKIGEGDMLYNTETGATFKNPKTKTPGSGTSGTDFLTTDNKKSLLGAGYSADEVELLAEDVKKYGLDSVMAQAKAGGATEKQLATLDRVYKVDADATEFLSKDYFKSLLGTDQLEKAAADAGFGDMGEGVFNLKDVDTEAYLTSLEGMINAYRQAGYTDKEILKLMQ